MDDKKDSKVLSNAIWVAIIIVIIYGSVTLYRKNQTLSEAPKLELSESDRKELKDELEKIVRNDLSTKATKINSVQIFDPEIPDANHISLTYEFSYDDNSKEEGTVTHKMRAVARLEKKADGWQIENVTPNEENLKFSTPLVIEFNRKKESSN